MHSGKISLLLSMAQFQTQNALALSPAIISQVYGSGGNASTPYRNDFIELFNRGMTTISLSSMSVQCARSASIGNFSSNPVALLSKSLALRH